MSDYKNNNNDDEKKEPVVGGASASDDFLNGFDKIIESFVDKSIPQDNIVEVTDAKFNQGDKTLTITTNFNDIDKFKEIQKVFTQHKGVSNVTADNALIRLDEIKLIISEQTWTALQYRGPLGKSMAGINKLDQGGEKNTRLKEILETILGHIKSGHSYTSTGGTNFDHDFFELGINTFGVLKLHNSKYISEGNVVKVDREKIGQKNPEYVLSVKKKDNSTISITEKMKETFLNYLTLLNFIIALIKNDKRFVSGEGENVENQGSLNTFLNNTENNLMKKQETKQYSEMGKLFGRPMTYTKKDWIGWGTFKVNKLDDESTPEKGMELKDDNYKYGPRVNKNKFIESGYTIVMEMLEELDNQKNKTNENEVSIDININELCNLLAVCEKENTSKKDISNKLVEELGKLVNLVEAEKKNANDNKIEFYKKNFLNVYGTQIFELDKTTLLQQVRPSAPEVRPSAPDLTVPYGTPSTGVAPPSTGDGVAGDEKEKQDGGSSSSSSSSESEGEKIDRREGRLVQNLSSSNSSENLFANRYLNSNIDPFTRLTTGPVAIGGAHEKVDGGNRDRDSQTYQRQKSKTLKRKQQTHNKSRRKFAYGGRKAYEQRKQKRQQQKQN